MGEERPVAEFWVLRNVLPDHVCVLNFWADPGLSEQQ